MPMVSGDYDVRCSVVVLRKHAVLLMHRTRDGLDDWVLPGGTPRDGESMTAAPFGQGRRRMPPG